MKKDPLIFINHILECIERIESFIENKSEEDFKESELIQSAVVRQLEIIGEATKNLSENFKNKYKFIPWMDIADTRNKLIHHYFGIDLEVVWGIIINELPELKEQIQEVLKKEQKK